MGKALKSYAEYKLRETTREYDFHYKHLKKLVTNMFTWEGLPEQISARFIEDVLFHNGLVVFHENKKKILTVSRAVSSFINSYDEPCEFNCYSRDMNELESERKTLLECVPIYNNTLMEGSSYEVSYFANKLANVDKTIDVNLDNIKTPFIITAPEGQQLTVETLMSKRANGEPWILMYEEGMRDIKVQPFNFDIKNYTKELTEMKQNIMAEALTYFGIDNVNVYKRERLTSGEVEQNDDNIAINRNSMDKMRQIASAKINDMFGLNTRVYMNEDVCEEVDKLCSMDNLEEIQ